MRFESSGAIRVQLVFAICDFATGAKTVSHQWSKKFIFTSLALFSVFASTARSDELNRFDGLPAWGSVLKAWEARENEFLTAKLRWVERRTYRQGSVMSPQIAKLVGYKGGGSRYGVPAVDVTFSKVANELLIKATWMKFKSKTLHHADPDRPFLVDYTSGFDGDQSRVLLSGYGSHATGIILRESKNTDTPIDSLKPIAFFLRGASKQFTGFTHPLPLVSKRQLIEKLSCVLIVSGLQRVWVDQSRGFVVIRWSELFKDGSVRARADIKYTKDGSGRWVPKSWKVKTYRADGEIASIFDAEMLSCNSSLDLQKRDFSVDFPTGTRVRDQTRNIEFIVLADRSERPILRSEIMAGLTHEQLANSRPGVLLQLGKSKARVLWIFGLVSTFGLMVLLACGAVFRWRRKRKPKSVDRLI